MRRPSLDTRRRPKRRNRRIYHIDIGRTRFILHNPTPEDLQHCISLHVWQCYLYAAAGYTADRDSPTRISWRRIAAETGHKVQKAETRGTAAAKREEKRIRKVLDRFSERFKRYGLGVLKRMAIIKDTASSTREIPILSADSTAVYRQAIRCWLGSDD